MYTVSSSNGVTLHFPSKTMYAVYLQDNLDLAMKHYGVIREKYGVWASNKNRFLQSGEELGPWDSRFMEDGYAAYIARRGAV